MATIDWIIFGILMGLLLLVGWWFRRYMRSVSDFIVADRKVRTYLSLSSWNAEGLGLVGVAYISEQGFEKGFGYVWLSLLNVLFCVPLFGILGIGIRRFRATRVQTLAQLHEMRFSRGVRICVGLALAVGGILNMAVFPLVSSNFLVHLLNLPLSVRVENIQIPTVYLCMFALVAVSLTTALLGGMITVIMTDFIQTILLSASLICVAFLIVTTVGFSRINDALSSQIGPSAYDPFLSGSYGITWVVFWVLSELLGSLAFPPTAAKLSSTDNTDTPRKMALLNYLFGSGRAVMVLLWGVAALAVLGNGLSESGGVPAEDYARYASAIFVRQSAPVGLLGLCAAGLVFAYVTVDSSYYLTWAAVVVNDVIVPIRGKPLPQEKHLLLLRVVMACIAAFLLFWGMVYTPHESILSYLYLTGAIFTAAGIVSYFGLYWKRANVAGAYCTVAICMLVPLADLVGKQVWGDGYPLKQHESGLIAFLGSIAAFIVCGLLNNSGTSKWVDYGLVVREEDRARRAAKLKRAES